jgi:hypothetical protein
VFASTSSSSLSRVSAGAAGDGLQDVRGGGEVKALLLLPLLIASCAAGPGVYYSKTGSVYAHTGWALLAARKEVIAEVETKGGDKIKYMAKGEEADDVALAAAAGYGMGIVSKHTNATEQVKATQSGATARTGIEAEKAVKLGEQAVQVEGFKAASEVPKFIPR